MEVISMMLTIQYPWLFEEFVDEFVRTDTQRTFPAMDMVENDREFLLFAEMPGVKKGDVNIKVEDGMLHISGERRPYEIPENAGVLLNEMRVKDFHRALRLPEEANVEAISAELENGVLRVVIPKREETLPRMIEIK
jgi:HSP20 family protein